MPRSTHRRKVIGALTVALLATTIALPAAQAHHDGQWYALPSDGSYAVKTNNNRTFDALAYYDGAVESDGDGAGQFHLELYTQDRGSLVHESSVVAYEDTSNATVSDCVWSVPDYRLTASDAVLNLSGDFSKNICTGEVNGTLTGTYSPFVFGATYELTLELDDP